jgi:hypothetical protein
LAVFVHGKISFLNWPGFRLPAFSLLVTAFCFRRLPLDRLTFLKLKKARRAKEISWRSIPKMDAQGITHAQRASDF